MEQQQIIDGLKKDINELNKLIDIYGKYFIICLGIMFVIIVLLIIAIKFFIDTNSNLEITNTKLRKNEIELENKKAKLEYNLENTKKELENKKTELEDTKKELEKTTSYLTFVYLSFAMISAMLRNDNLIRNEKNRTLPPIVEEIGKFRDKYEPEKFARNDFRKLDSEFKTKLDQLTSLNINSIDLAYK